jgi:hypothetical protein
MPSAFIDLMQTVADMCSVNVQQGMRSVHRDCYHMVGVLHPLSQLLRRVLAVHTQVAQLKV